MVYATLLYEKVIPLKMVPVDVPVNTDEAMPAVIEVEGIYTFAAELSKDKVVVVPIVKVPSFTA
jgi:hypothetical protein